MPRARSVGRRSTFTSGSQSRARTSQRPNENLPASAPAASLTQPQNAPKQPGLFANMASTAAGVAVGSTVGHTLGNAITGVFSGASDRLSQEPQQMQKPIQENAASDSIKSENKCEYEMRQFLECAQGQRDITLCQGFNEALKQCNLSYQSGSAMFV